MSRRRWSDLFLIIAATSLILGFRLSGSARALAVLSLVISLATGARIRRRIV